MDHKTFPFELKADLLPIPEGGAEFVGHAAVFGNVDEGGDIIQPGAFAKTLSERANRVALVWQHDWKSPIGKLIELYEDDRGLYVRGKISDTALGRDVSALLRDGAVNGLSIGYAPVKEQTISLLDGRRARSLQEVKLFEVSPVTFPMNEQATIAAVKAALPFKKYPLADEGTAWDAGREVAAAEVDDLRQMCAIVLNDGESKSDYKLPHHTADGYKTVWRAVAAAGSVLQGGRGGVNASEDEIAGAKAHLAKHYDEFDKPAPWSKSFEPAHMADYEPEEKIAIALSMLEMEKGNDPNFNYDEDWNDGESETKEGRVLSARNRGVIQAAMDALKTLLAATEPLTTEPMEDEALAEDDAEKTITPEALMAQVEELRARVAAKSKLLTLGR